MTEAIAPLFNQADRFAQGWYWALPSRSLKREASQSVTLLGRPLVLYRDRTKTPIALDALTAPDLSVLDHVSLSSDWPTVERYGLIWVWVGEHCGHELPSLPYPPELENVSCDAHLCDRFRRQCHPNVLLINAIDAQHFNFVHNLPLEISFKTEALSRSALTFSNVTRGGEASRFVRFIRPLYQNEVTYRLCYWYGSTGTVTLGPDFFHFYLMFALRPGEKGTTEGWIVLLTPKRAGLLGWLLNRVALGITWLVAAYFSRGDRKVFDSIKFDLKTPIAADRSIVKFVQHVNRQPALAWKSWQPQPFSQ